MKRLLTVAIGILFVAFHAQANNGGEKDNKEIKWYSIEEADSMMKIEKRKVYIDVYTDWCGWCKVMERKTFTDPEIIELLNTEFYAVKLNGEGKEDITFKNKTFKYVEKGRSKYHELAAALMNGKMSYPTSVFLDENLNMIQPLPGYMPPDKLEPILEFIGRDYYKNTSWKEFQAKRNQ